MWNGAQGGPKVCKFMHAQQGWALELVLISSISSLLHQHPGTRAAACPTWLAAIIVFDCSAAC